MTFRRALERLFQPARYKFIKGGRGSGKSWGVARALLIEGAREKHRILCTREIIEPHVQIAAFVWREPAIGPIEVLRAFDLPRLVDQGHAAAAARSSRTTT